MYRSENFSNFYTQLVVCSIPNHGVFHKEESQRWTHEIVTSNQKLIGLRAEFSELYMMFKIYFEKDDVLKNLINDYLKTPAINLQQFAGILNVDDLVKIRDSNFIFLKEKFKEEVLPKQKQLMDYLDGIISKIE